MHALDELDRLKAADPVTTTPEVPDFERAVMARVEARAAGAGPRRRRRWTRRVVATAALGVVLAVAVPALLLRSDEVDVLAAGARAVALGDGHTLHLAYDVVRAEDGSQTFSEHQEITSDPHSRRYLAVVTIGERRTEMAWDGSSFLRWTSTRPDVVQKIDAGPAGRKDAAPDGQVGILRWMYRTHRLRVAGERDAGGARQWVLRGTVARGTTMTAILDAKTFVPVEVRSVSTNAAGVRTVISTRYTEFSHSTEPVPDGLPGRSRLRVVTTRARVR